MSDTTRRYIDMFWELIDEILNATLFVLIGMEVLLVRFSLNVLVAVGAAVLVTLLARWLTVGVPVRLGQGVFNLSQGSWKVLTWGGLRGGISVALALSLPASAQRDTVVAITYGVVVFSILVQGSPLVAWCASPSRRGEPKKWLGDTIRNSSRSGSQVQRLFIERITNPGQSRPGRSAWRGS